MAEPVLRRYVVLPVVTSFNAETSTSSRAFSRRLAGMGANARDRGLLELEDLQQPIRVLDSIDSDAITLVEMSEEQRVLLSGRYPGLQIAPEGKLRLLRARPFETRLRPAKSAARSRRTLAVAVTGEDGIPIVGADIVVVFNEKNRTGVSGLRTDARGRVEVRLPPRLTKVDLVIVSPFGGYWPADMAAVELTKDGAEIALSCVKIVDGVEDSLDQLCKCGGKRDGKGVRIAVIDAGVSPPASIVVKRGLNTTGTEPPELWTDNGSGHGTHVAGIIARLAPGAELHVYRVFEQGAEVAKELAIARAIRDAVDQGCDLINLSLGQKPEPIAIIQEVRRARAYGTVCVAAAGNDYQNDVDYPARSIHAQAIAACGHEAGWPSGTPVVRERASHPPAQGEVFFAAFSNKGPEIDFLMPGAGIISHVNGEELGVMSGTSMAAPAATGVMARLLSANSRLLNAERNQQRSDDIVRLAFEHVEVVGFGPMYEGKGLLK